VAEYVAWAQVAVMGH